MTYLFGPYLRCELTENVCGTDTWEVNHPCQCLPCQLFLATQKLDESSRKARAFDWVMEKIRNESLLYYVEGKTFLTEERWNVGVKGHWGSGYTFLEAVEKAMGEKAS